MNKDIGATMRSRPTLAGHVKIARVDHWVKNVFVLPGVLAAAWSGEGHFSYQLAWHIVAGLVATGLIASSNYVINEVLDAPHDRQHPVKCRRPVPAGEVSIPLAYAEWIGLMLAGLALAFHIAAPLGITLAVLWLMGCIYNIRPVRSKELPYVDVLSEAVNNPLRLLAGWYMTTTQGVPPASLLMSYWMVGGYFMAIKRYAELLEIGATKAAASYRRSFAYYTPPRLLVAITFYGATAMLFLGAFTMRYRLELILAYPLIALVMAVYLQIAFKPHSAAQAPEKLYREPGLMASVCVCAVALGVLLFVDIPPLHHLFAPMVPAAVQAP